MKRLENARLYRARVTPDERVTYRPISRGQDLTFYGNAGHAVLEVWTFAQGLATAHELTGPSTGILEVDRWDGESAGAWADRCTDSILSWYRENFVEDDAAGTSRGRRHRMLKRVQP